MPEPMGGSRDLVWQGVLVRQGQSYNVTWLSEHDVITKVHALIADKDRRAGDEFANLVFAFAAERAMQGSAAVFLGTRIVVAVVCHE